LNEELGKLYGETLAGSDFQRVSLENSGRMGLLTQPWIMASHSKEMGTSSFIVGRFIRENLLCETIPAPPAEAIAASQATQQKPGQTLRQVLEEKTSGAACVSCHSRIGPPGFAFLPFDPLGRMKRMDAQGVPFDTKGILLDKSQKETSFEGADGLSQLLSEHTDYLSCFSRTLFRHAMGRNEAAGDEEVLRKIQSVSVATKGNLRAVLEEIVSSESFAKAQVD
jgi:hypothetical protein